MKLSATFEDGSLSLILEPETESEQKMVGAVIDQPQSDLAGYLDKELISASLRYEGHWTYKRIERVKLTVYRPNRKEQAPC